MKKIITIIILISSINLVTSNHSYAQTDDEMFYKSKIASFQKMQSTGIGMTVGGVLLTIGGIAMVNSADWVTDPSTGQLTTDDGNGGLGILAITGGIPLTIAGAILLGIGGKKKKEYMGKLNNLRLGYFRKSNANGLTLTYRF